ncbi:PiggyBac transposable element-derived protein 2 [Trichinella sp. T8]|nr:PiggyBac transposable element-derived protein 2 [Trichinella sp. T8]
MIRAQSTIYKARNHTAIVMDCDLNVRLSRSGRIMQELIVLPDADISEPETDSLMQKYLNLKHQRSFSVVESSAELTSENEESETFRKTEFRWKNRRMPPIDATFKETASGSSCVLIEPVQYFRQYFHPTLLNHIVEQCHVCAAQCNSNFQITESELETFLGALLKMGLVPKPQYSMYWSTELRCDAIADAMSRNRFRGVLSYLHFNDNSEAVVD